MSKFRCPHCHAKLGDFYYADACPRCHGELKHNSVGLVLPAVHAPAGPRSWPVRLCFGIVRLIES